MIEKEARERRERKRDREEKERGNFIHVIFVYKSVSITIFLISFDIFNTAIGRNVHSTQDESR